MTMLKEAFIIAIPVLLAGIATTAHADYYACQENCPASSVTYKVDTYEDNQHFCGYDVEAKPQVCAQTQVVQVDTSRITRTSGDGRQQLNAETSSDLKYTSKVSFGDDT